MNRRISEPENKDDRKPPPAPPPPPEIEEEDGDIATPKRDRDDEAPE